MINTDFFLLFFTADLCVCCCYVIDDRHLCVSCVKTALIRMGYRMDRGSLN